MNILVTGGAGFIGSHTVKALVERGDKVVVVDNLNDYYDPKLKQDRLDIFLKDSQFDFYEVDIADLNKLNEVFEKNSFDCIVHLAAQAGVRYSIDHPFVYEKSNLQGTLNLLELAKDFKVSKFVFASSSSVYGANKVVPFSESHSVDHPISLYAATKKAGELMVHNYYKQYGIKCVCLRFFTVYGPCGRPDMAIFKFTKLISEGKPIDAYNFGKMKRDFTYVSDIVQGVLASVDKEFDYEIFNLGGDHPIELGYFIECIEKALGKISEKNLLPLQQGDMVVTMADISKARALLDFNPKTSIEDGINNFVEWYNSYFR